MGRVIHHEVPRRSADGTTSIYCRKCGREVARRAMAQIRSVTKCAICVLQEQGVKDPEQYVLPQYVMTDPTKPALPLSMESEDALYMLFPEERPNEGEAPPPVGGIMGTAKAIFRALGFAKDIEKK